jgi:hypothetical protein
VTSAPRVAVAVRDLSVGAPKSLLSIIGHLDRTDRAATMRHGTGSLAGGLMKAHEANAIDSATSESSSGYSAGVSVPLL